MLMTTTENDGAIRAGLSCDACGKDFDPPGMSMSAPALVWAAAYVRGWRDEVLGGVTWQRCPACVAVSSAAVEA